MEDGIATRRLHGWNPGVRHAPGGRLWAALTASLAQQWIRHEGLPDVIHAHNALWAGVAARAISGATGVPYVITEHSSQVLMEETSRAQRRGAIMAWRDAATVVAVSRPLADAVMRHGIDVEVIPNPVDVEFFVPPTERDQDDATRFVTVANLNTNKAVDVLVQAFAEIAPTRPGARLDIVGDGPERTTLTQLARALAVGDRVTFHGARPRAEIRSLLWRSSCFVSTSRNETFGVAIAEALATGLPVIATRSGGPEDLLADGIGCLVPRDDRAAIAAAMRDFVTPTPATRARARDRIVKRCAPSVVADRYSALFRRGLSSTRPQSR
jgi:glycosyltransferase involved in cell wall biosynthesis